MLAILIVLLFNVLLCESSLIQVKSFVRRKIQTNATCEHPRENYKPPACVECLGNRDINTYCNQCLYNWETTAGHDHCGFCGPPAEIRLSTAGKEVCTEVSPWQTTGARILIVLGVCAPIVIGLLIACSICLFVVIYVFFIKKFSMSQLLGLTRAGDPRTATYSKKKIPGTGKYFDVEKEIKMLEEEKNMKKKGLELQPLEEEES